MSPAALRRHTPTLFTHPENDADDEEEDSAWPSTSRHTFPPPSTTMPNTRSRIRQKVSLPTNPSASGSSQRSDYSNIYNQFVRRYRSGPGIDDDSRVDPDSHYYNSRLSQLLDGGDSDDEDLRESLNLPVDGRDRLSTLILDTETIEPESLEDRERLEWQTMLASVLSGDVLKAENSRIAGALKSSMEEENSQRAGLWLGIRAWVHGRSEADEKKKLEERRLRLVDPSIKSVLSFRVTDLPPDSPESASDHALQEVNAMLHQLDIALSLYPSFRAFYLDHPIATNTAFQARRDALNTWSTVIISLRQQIEVLRKWTGSDTLDVTQTSTSTTPSFPGAPINGDNGLGTPFVERLLKEEGIQRQFEKGAMTTIHALVGTTRDAHVNLAVMFQEMNLPSFERELVPLVSFLTNLAQAVLRVRLDYAQKLKNPDILIIDQLTEDLKVKIGFACALKRQYEAFLLPDPGGNWKLPPCISDDYDSVILEALTFFFRLIHWKLKGGMKGIYFKETDVIEAQWATFADVSLTVPGGASLVAEQLCALTNKLMIRVTNYFDTQIRIPVPVDEPPHPSARPNGQMSDRQDSSSAFQSHLKPADTSNSRVMTNDQITSWYGKILDGVKQRYRKLQRLTRVLTSRFSNSAEYDLQDMPLDLLMTTLVQSDHCLIYTQSFEEEGLFVIVSPSLREQSEEIRRIFLEAFHVNDSEEGIWFLETGDNAIDDEEDPSYILILSTTAPFLWNGPILVMQLPKFDLKLGGNRARLIADGAQHRLALAKRAFAEIFVAYDEEGMPIESELPLPPCVVEAQAHLPSVNHELRKISRATNRLAESIVDSVHHVRNALRDADGYQELLENWYAFASEYGQHVAKYMDQSMAYKYNRLLIHLAISWVSFICDDCDPNDRRTFRWAVTALEFTLHRTRRNNILHLPDEQFEMLRQKVASCMTLLISHFDILGARSAIEAKKEKERLEELIRQNSGQLRPEDEDAMDAALENQCHTMSYTDSSTRMFWEKATRAVRDLETKRASAASEQHTVGRVLDEEKMVDRSLVFLAASRSNISIRWQQGRFIGAGSFGSVYLAVNLDSGSLMAVKEIRFQEVAGLTSLYSQIKDELSVMEMLHHPNIVEYYGIEVHRDKVYIFEEYCQAGSLAALLEHGRIEEEHVLQLYTMQLLEGLAYLHSEGILHRDIKPDNILMDHQGVIKYVDFGAAKILARNQRSIARSRRVPDGLAPHLTKDPDANNSLTGTPMYMSPEVIRNNHRGREGAMDIWSLGCVVLECATGRKPWSNLDNEWAIMFHIGVATQHPPLPDPHELSELGIDFIRQCLIIDPAQRPTAVDLMDHPWMQDFSRALHDYEEELAMSPPVEMPPEADFKSATVARQAAIIQEKEVETIKETSPSLSPLETPNGSDTSSIPNLSRRPTEE